MSDFSQLNLISKELGLDFLPQDWGIANSNSSRLEEFIEYFNNSNNLENYCVMELFELIIASANDALVEGKLNGASRMAFDMFIRSNNENELLKLKISYWKRIYDVEEFPIGALL